MPLPPPPPPPTRLAPPGWGIGDVFLGLAVGIGASVLIGGIAVVAAGYERTADIPLWMMALLQVPLWLGLFGVPILVARRRGNGPVVDFGATMRPRDAPLGVLLGVAAQFILVPLVSFPWMWLLGRDVEDIERPARELTDRAQGLSIIILVIVVVLGAPIVEELFFRGLALRAFQRRFGTVVAVLASSVLFGIVHFQVLQLPALMAFGVVLGVVTLRTRRLGPAVWAHLGFNLTTVILLLATR